MSDDSRSRSITPFTELLELTQQLTPHKTPDRTRQICLDIQSLVNDVGESHSNVKRQLADVTNQLGSTHQPRKRRLRGNRSAEAPGDVENPDTLEDRVRKAGRHFVIEYGLFLLTDAHVLLATEEDPNFKDKEEFANDASRIQGQLRDVIALLPADARPIRGQAWIASAFVDGMNNQRSTIHSRLRHESLALIAASIKFDDGEAANIDDFETSASRFNAFAKRIGYQPATADAAAFYSILKAEVLFSEYDGTMNVDKAYRGPLPIVLYACIIRGPHGAKGLFEGKSRLPAARVTQRVYRILRTAPAAIAASGVWAIWFLSADTQMSSSGEGDETQIDYKFYFETFLRQLRVGLNTKAEWALELFQHWDDILFPNTEDSLGQTAAINHEAVQADIDSMDAAFRAAPRRESTPAPTPPREPSRSPSRSPSPPSPPPPPPPPRQPPPARTPAPRDNARRPPPPRRPARR
ncbi:hypothetical protein C8R46DRAFT_1042208 [Mycena filopes]|nr:hypothetical protein C8R46DRAFT_1042208 [Mycena filopes]